MANNKIDIRDFANLYVRIDEFLENSTRINFRELYDLRKVVGHWYDNFNKLNGNTQEILDAYKSRARELGIETK